MKISYAITVCTEFEEIQRLVPFLISHKRSEDEIVILYDKRNGSGGVEEYLRSHSANGEFIWHGEEFKGDFSQWKNDLGSMCSGDYIFQIDADELPSLNLVKNLHLLLESYPDVDLFLVPRINTVEGITESHIQKWKWNISEKFGFQCINYPDFQTRIYKNSDKIKWESKVHERISGFNTVSSLPQETSEWCLYHHKTVEKQEKQNSFYEKLGS